MFGNRRKLVTLQRKYDALAARLEETTLAWIEAMRTKPKPHPTLAETRTGTDWCLSCNDEVGTDRYTEDGREHCALCGTPLIEYAPKWYTPPGWLNVELPQHDYGNHPCTCTFCTNVRVRESLLLYGKQICLRHAKAYLKDVDKRRDWIKILGECPDCEG